MPEHATRDRQNPPFGVVQSAFHNPQSAIRNRIMTKLSRRDAERRLEAITAQRDQALRIMRLWVYLVLAAVLTLLFVSPIWGVLYMVLFVVWTVVTTRLMRRAAGQA
jgi:hypothetical protein